jgi:hypothetical protein
VEISLNIIFINFSKIKIKIKNLVKKLQVAASIELVFCNSLYISQVSAYKNIFYSVELISVRAGRTIATTKCGLSVTNFTHTPDSDYYKEFRRKLSWPNRGTSPTLAWSDGAKPCKT